MLSFIDQIKENIMTYINKKVIFTLTVTALFTLGFVSQAAATDVTAQVSITQPTLTIATTAPLDFGAIIPALTSSSITINAAGGPVAAPTVLGSAIVTGGNSGAIDVITNVDSNVSIACDEVYGINSAAGADDGILAIFGGNDDAGTYNADAIALLASTVETNSTATGLLATAGPAGTNTVNVGGVINVSNALQTGTYSGTVVFTVSYQ